MRDPAPIDARYLDADFVRALREGLGADPPKIDVLVAIPSNTSFLAAALALACRRVVLVDSGPPTHAAWDAARAWAVDHGRPGLVPERGEVAVTDAQLVAYVARQLEGVDAARVAVWVTGGQSHQTCRLVQYANAVGCHPVHVSVSYRDRQPDPTGPLRVELLELPSEVAERHAQDTALRLLAAASPGQAVLVMDAVDFPSPYSQALHRWCLCCVDRQALRFDRALRAAREVIALCSRQPGRDPRTVALLASVERARRALEGLDRADPMRLFAECIALAERERAAGRLQHAALLLYRAAEAIVSHVLVRDHGIRADDGLHDSKILEGPAGDRWRALSNGRDPSALSRPIGLLDGAALLVALETKNFPGEGQEERSAFLGRLRNANTVRNRSILIHGFEQTDEQALEDLRTLVVTEKGRRGLMSMAGREYGDIRADHVV